MGIKYVTIQSRKIFNTFNKLRIVELEKRTATPVGQKVFSRFVTARIAKQLYPKATITESGFENTGYPDARKYIAQRAELFGAVRLPNNAFFKNAGTETTMDIIFLKKRELIDLQLEEHSAAEIQAQQDELNDLYDTFTAEYGLISSTGA